MLHWRTADLGCAALVLVVIAVLATAMVAGCNDSGWQGMAVKSVLAGIVQPAIDGAREELHALVAAGGFYDAATGEYQFRDDQVAQFVTCLVDSSLAVLHQQKIEKAAAVKAARAARASVAAVKAPPIPPLAAPR